MRIATWNTWWQFDAWEERQPLLADTLAALDADVVLLQETWPEQAAQLAQACELTVVDLAVGPFEIPDWDGPADTPFGNAILARPGIAESIGGCGFDSPDDVTVRAVIGATVDTGGGPVLVATTHLNHRSTHGRVRLAQLDAIDEWLNERADALGHDGPVLLGGDLNQTPYSDEYRDGIAARWVDLWTLHHPDDLGATMVPENTRLTYVDWMRERNEAHTGPGGPPAVRFDYLLARPAADGGPALTPTAMRLIGGADDRWPSDHLGIVADLA